MSLLQTNHNPPCNITRASHIVLTSRDLAKARDYYTEVIGLVVTDQDKNTVWLRGVEEIGHHSLTLKKTSGKPSCERIGFRMFQEEDLDKAKKHFDKSGIKAEWAEVPHQGKTLHVSDTIGTPLEFCATMKTLPRMQNSVHLHKGAGALRIDHYQVLSPDVLKSAKFYTDLGFRVSDYFVIPGTEIAIGCFMYRKDNPHDMVFLHRAGPVYHHAGYIVRDVHAMFKACDCAGNLGFGTSIEYGPGRHSLGHWYYTYLRDPDGHRTELLLPAVQMTDIDEVPGVWEAKEGFAVEAWGLPAQQPWWEETSPFVGVEPVAPHASGDPVTLEKWLARRAEERKTKA